MDRSVEARLVFRYEISYLFVQFVFLCGKCTILLLKIIHTLLSKLTHEVLYSYYVESVHLYCSQLPTFKCLHHQGHSVLLSWILMISFESTYQAHFKMGLMNNWAMWTPSEMHSILLHCMVNYIFVVLLGVLSFNNAWYISNNNSSWANLTLHPVHIIMHLLCTHAG